MFPAVESERIIAFFSFFITLGNKSVLSHFLIALVENSPLSIHLRKLTWNCYNLDNDGDATGV